MLKIEKGGKKGANFPRTVYLPFLFSSYLIAVLYALNSKALIDTSAIYYKDSEYNALGGIDACVKDAVTKNRFPKNGTFFKNFTAGTRYLAVGYRYENGTYGLIVLYKFGMKLDYRYSIQNGAFSKIS